MKNITDEYKDVLKSAICKAIYDIPVFRSANSPSEKELMGCFMEGLENGTIRIMQMSEEQ